jgi:ribosomal protein L37AE/L43A
MSEPAKPEGPARPTSVLRTTPPPAEAMVCERCGSGNVYRMHAVWRCADCGFKTDCCGW